MRSLIDRNIAWLSAARRWRSSSSLMAYSLPPAAAGAFGSESQAAPGAHQNGADTDGGTEEVACFVRSTYHSRRPGRGLAEPSRRMHDDECRSAQRRREQERDPVA